MIEAQIAPVLAAHKIVQSMLPALLKSLKDTTIQIDVRWDAYTRLVEAHILVNEASMADGYLAQYFGQNSVSLYDDFYMDRNQTRTFPEIWEKIVDEDDDTMTAYADPAKRDAWRERVLASGYSGFEYDW